MADIATMYYFDSLSQNEIARRVGVSRSAVSNLLQEAQNQGIVTFHINRPLLRVHSLEYALKQKFGLQEVRVVERDEASEYAALDRIGQCSASLLADTLHKGMVLGISPGTGVSAVIRQMADFGLFRLSILCK